MSSLFIFFLNEGKEYIRHMILFPFIVLEFPVNNKKHRFYFQQ